MEKLGEIDFDGFDSVIMNKRKMLSNGLEMLEMKVMNGHYYILLKRLLPNMKNERIMVGVN